ncbi:MAG: sulfotransferase family protein [Pseudomonadota bacterium]
MNYQFSVSLKNKYIFCEVAKSGCSTIKRELWRQELADVPMPPDFYERHRNPHVAFAHHLLVKPFQLGPALFNDMVRDPGVVKWTLVRNPFSRALSGYLDKVVRNEPQFLNIKRQIAQNRDTPLDSVDHSTVTFEEFCLALCAFEKPMQFDPHWRPQYLHTCSDILPYTYTGRLETLHRSEEEIARLLGLQKMDFTKGRDHATGADGKIEEYYSDHSADLIRKVYNLDFEKFGYSRDLPV